MNGLYLVQVSFFGGFVGPVDIIAIIMVAQNGQFRFGVNVRNSSYQPSISSARLFTISPVKKMASDQAFTSDHICFPCMVL